MRGIGNPAANRNEYPGFPGEKVRNPRGSLPYPKRSGTVTSAPMLITGIVPEPPTLIRKPAETSPGPVFLPLLLLWVKVSA